MSAETEELRRLVNLLEHSGLAARRPDVAALIDVSRSRLGAGGMPPRRARGRARAKAGALLVLLLDASALGGMVAALVSLVLMPRPEALPVAVLAAAAIWGLVRSPAAREVIAGSGFWLRYHLRWGWLWLAEAFSPASATRLDALLYGRDVMRAWRRHRRSLPHIPAMPDLEGFLRQAYGPQAVTRFRELAADPGWTLRGGSAPAAPSLRWSFLIPRFEGLAASGALWPDIAPPPAAAVAPRAEPVPLPAEGPEIAQRRQELRELIKRKREEINTAHGWKLKTAAEIAQRDLHLNALREEIRALEAELHMLGGDQNPSKSAN